VNQSKWILISLGLMAAASVGMVACGDDEKVECTTDEDCDVDGGEICSTATGKCEVACTTGGDECDDEFGEICSDVCQQAQSHCFVPCHSDGDCVFGEEFCDLSFCGARGGICVPNKGCTTDTDCDEDKVCEAIPGATTSSCVDKCTSDEDCFAGSACNTTTGHCIAIGAACTTNDDCGTGNVCNNNVCEPAPTDACDDQQTCYDRGNQFCASTESDVNVCTDTSCGVSFNSCSRCTSGPNGGDRDEDGPQIFAASQVTIGTGGRNCRNDLTQCQPDAPILCEFQFFAFSPTDADLPSGSGTALNKNVFVISGTGKASNPFGVTRGEQSGLTTYSFRSCFTEGNNTPGTAAYLVSVSGKRSNTLCTIGSK